MIGVVLILFGQAKTTWSEKLEQPVKLRTRHYSFSLILSPEGIWKKDEKKINAKKTISHDIMGNIKTEILKFWEKFTQKL